MSAPHNKPIDTLKLTRRDRRRLLGEMDKPRRKHPRRRDRRQMRVSYDVARVIVALAQPDGGVGKYSVVPRNLSAQGMAFIHGRFIYEDSRCEVVLPTLDGSWTRKYGSIVMCRHVRGCVHEASIVFDEPICLETFVEAARTATPVAPGSAINMDVLRAHPLSGRALVVDPFDSDRSLSVLWLERMGLEVSHTDDTAEALDMLLSRFDLIVMDPVRHADGWAVVSRMRESDITAPIIGISADDRDECRARAQAAGCNAFLGKPWKPYVLHMVIEQLLLVEPSEPADSDDGPMYSSFTGDPEMLPLIDAFASDARRMATELEGALQKRDLAALRSTSQQLKGVGDGYGFAPITEQARLVMQLFQVAQPDVEELDRSVTDLVRRIRVR